MLIVYEAVVLIYISLKHMIREVAVMPVNHFGFVLNYLEK